MKSEKYKDSLIFKNKTQPNGLPWFRASFFLIVLFLVIIPFTDIPKVLKDYAKELIVVARDSKKIEKPHDVTKKHEYVAPEAENPVVIKSLVTQDKDEITSLLPAFPDKIYQPKEHFVGTKGDMIRMSKGFHFDYSFETSKGKLASSERKNKQSYVAEYKLKVPLPMASSSIEELANVNEHLPNILPGLAEMLQESEVSNFFYTLYENKIKRLERQVLKLNELSTKHNFYDCETILNLTNSQSGRNVLLVQSDMDVVSDGSDGDRLAKMPDEIVNSTHYQPFTSYGWKKTGKIANPMLAGWKKRIVKAEHEMADKKTSESRKAWLESRVKMLKRGVSDMRYRSFLIAEYDPFIVMPVNMITNRNDKFAARVGDYALVIYKDKVYPAIVGDGGPTFKVGEGSLRLAKELNSKASSYSRPVSDVSVTYLVFSNSRDLPATQPNYEHWHARCSELVKEIGGLGEGFELIQWENLFDAEADTAESLNSESSENKSTDDDKSLNEN